MVGRIAGTGIGLAASRHAVAQHGGAIEVDTSEGNGSTLTVRLPLSSEDDVRQPHVGDMSDTAG